MQEAPLRPVVFWLRLLWVSVQLTLVIWLAQQGAFFFYQGF